jgi:phosphopentomutase
MVQIIDVGPDAMPIDRGAKRAIDESIPVQDRVLMAVESFVRNGDRIVYQSVDDIASRASMPNVNTFQALYRLAKKGMIEILTEMNGNRKRIVGFKLNKAPEPSQVIQNGEEKAKTHRVIVKRNEPKVSSRLVHLNEYMQKKIAVGKASDALVEAGIDPTDVSNALANLWHDDPMAEEAIAIFNELSETLREKNEMALRLEGNRQTREVVGTPATEES